jgi:hypothetical protein
VKTASKGNKAKELKILATKDTKGSKEERKWGKKRWNDEERWGWCVQTFKFGLTKKRGIGLSGFLFGVSEDFWMNLQLRWDLYIAKCTELKELKTIKPLIQKV